MSDIRSSNLTTHFPLESAREMFVAAEGLRKEFGCDCRTPLPNFYLDKRAKILELMKQYLGVEEYFVERFPF